MDIKHVLSKKAIDGLDVEYDLCIPEATYDDYDNSDIIDDIEKSEFELKVSKFLEEYTDTYRLIDSMSNKADWMDYAVAASSGLIAGAIDVVFVREFDFEGSYERINSKFKERVIKKADRLEKEKRDAQIAEAIEKGKKKAEEKGKKFSEENAKTIADNIKNKYKDKNDIDKKIQKAIEKAKQTNENLTPEQIKEITEIEKNKAFAKKVKLVEDCYNIPSDNAFDENGNGIDAKSHHLDDLAHHPTLVGLAASIITQFTGNAHFQNKDGVNITAEAASVKVFKNVKVYVKRGNVKEYQEGKDKIIEVTLIGTGFKEKIACGVLNWLGHLVSDMAGSRGSALKGSTGMGLPGPIMATLKEVAMLPIIKNTGLPKILHELFTKDDLLFGKYRLDLRSELAFKNELGKQAVPVIINEVIVRSFYAIRRFVENARDVQTLKDIQWDRIIPWKNRTIVRMMTVSTGTMEIVDLGAAAIQAGIQSGGNLAIFGAQFVLRINFVGIGRCAIACATDIAMGVKRSRMELSLVPGSVAVTALETIKTINEIEKTKTITDKKLKELEKEVESLSRMKF